MIKPIGNKIRSLFGGKNAKGRSGKKPISDKDIKDKERKQNAGKSKDKKKHDAKVRKGLAYLHSQERKIDNNGNEGITEEEAKKVAAKTKRKHKVFTSITPRRQGKKWVYDWKGSRGTEGGANVETERGSDTEGKAANSLWKEKKGKVFKSARPIVNKVAKNLLDNFFKKKDGTYRKVKWATFLERLKKESAIKELTDNPIKNTQSYGTETKAKVSKIGASVLQQKGVTDSKEIKETIDAKINTMNARSQSGANLNLRQRIFDSSLGSKTHELVKAVFEGKAKEHTDYKIVSKDLNFKGSNDGKLVINYSYQIKKEGQQPETKRFSISLEQAEYRGRKVIKHTAQGFNIAVKDVGRGRVDSVSSEEAKTNLGKADQTKIKQVGNLPNSVKGNKNQEILESNPTYNKQTKLKDIIFNASHLIADWFQGTGYRAGLNLVHTSEHYNKVVMLNQEKAISNAMKEHENDMISLHNSKGAQYITFNMIVNAYWDSLTDGFIEQEIKELSNAAMKVDSPEDKNKVAKLIVNALAKKADPKVCHGVDYNVFGVQIKGANGKPIKGGKSGFSDEFKIPEDTHLKDVIK